MMSFRKALKAATAVAALFVVVSATNIQSAAAEFHGAIAFSQTTGATGWSYDFGTRGAAENRAIQECSKHGGGCRVATWFKNGCGALAIGDGNAYGGSWGRTRFEAESKALKLCSAEARNCAIKRWVCTKK